MKYSRQRELILEAVRSHGQHPTADMVYSLLYPENPNLSLGTVYRNLNCLAVEGKITRIMMPFGGDRFDGTLIPHYHMLCESCGRVEDCPIEVMSGFESAVYQKTGFTMGFHKMAIIGVCEICRCEGNLNREAKLLRTAE